MTGTLIDRNENEDVLTDEELAVLQMALGRFRKKQFDEGRRRAAKLEEIEIRERLKMEKEQIKTDREAKRTAARDKARLEAAAQKQQEREEKARERTERDAAKAEVLEVARVARNKDRAFRDAERAAARENDVDAKAAIRLRAAQKLGQGPFAHWDPAKMLRRITDGLSNKNPLDGLMVINHGKSMVDLVVAIDHPAIMKKLDCPVGYHLVLHGHPQVIDRSRAVWFGENLERCIVFSLPIDTDTDAGDTSP